MTVPLRGRAREALRDQLAREALTVITTRGFEITTDELARALGVSRASFFRYFGTKEDAVISAIESGSPGLDQLIRDQATASDSDAWDLLYRVALKAAEIAERDPDPVRRQVLLIQSTPVLKGRLQVRRGEQMDRLTSEIASRIVGGRFAARLMSAMAVTLLDQCWDEWAHGNEPSMQPLVNTAFTQTRPAKAIPLRPTSEP
jgi:AcrR family transcriptional regulator